MVHFLSLNIWSVFYVLLDQMWDCEICNLLPSVFIFYTGSQFFKLLLDSVYQSINVMTMISLYSNNVSIFYMLILIYHHCIKTQCSCRFIIGGKQDGQPIKAKTTEEKLFLETWRVQHRPVVYPSYIAATRNSFLHFSIDLGASIINAYKLSQQQILCKHVATLQLVQQSPRIHDQNRQMFEPAL